MQRVWYVLVHGAHGIANRRPLSQATRRSPSRRDEENSHQAAEASPRCRCPGHNDSSGLLGRYARASIPRRPTYPHAAYTCHRHRLVQSLAEPL